MTPDFSNFRIDLLSVATIPNLNLGEMHTGVALMDPAPESHAAIIAQPTTRRDIRNNIVQIEAHTRANDRFVVLFDREKFMATGASPTITEELRNRQAGVEISHQSTDKEIILVGDRILQTLENEITIGARSRGGFQPVHERILEILPTLATVVRSTQEEGQIPQSTVITRPDQHPVLNLQTAGRPEITVKNVAIDAAKKGKVTFTVDGLSLTITTSGLLPDRKLVEPFLIAYDPTLHSQAFGRSGVSVPPRVFGGYAAEVKRFVEIAAFALQDKIQADKNQGFEPNKEVLAARNALLRV